MPPVGTCSTQIAGVLTYIRREWGQTGSVVIRHRETVRQRRPGARPWTTDELTALAAGKERPASIVADLIRDADLIYGTRIDSRTGI